MRADNLKIIFDNLNNWMTERHLKIEDQKAGIIPNLLEELTEYYRASIKEDKIDALCDIATFVINSLSATEKAIILSNLYYTINPSNPIGVIADEISNIINIRASINTYSRVLFACFAKIIDLGYKPFECMLETYKEINSRSGKFDDKINKFVKHMGAYTSNEALAKVQMEGAKIEDKGNHWIINNNIKVVKHYKANYSNCKL